MENAPDMASGYTASQAARLLGVSRHEVARLVRNGTLRARKTDSGTLAIDPGSVHAHEALGSALGAVGEGTSATADGLRGHARVPPALACRATTRRPRARPGTANSAW